MSWFKKKDKPLIPPVEDTSGKIIRQPFGGNDGGAGSTRNYGDSYSSQSSSYNRPPVGGYGDRAPASGGYGDRAPASGGYGDRAPPRDFAYRRNLSDQAPRGGPGGDAELSAAKNELFGGAKLPERSRFAGFSGGRASGANGGQGEDEEDDEEMIKTKIRSTKSDTVEASREAIRIARETEATGQATLDKLVSQTEALAGVERSIDTTKGHSLRADDNVHDIKQFNKSIFNPAVTFNKKKKREAQEEKLRLRHEEEAMDRERNRDLLRDAQRRADSYNTGYDQPRDVDEADRIKRKEDRKRYQFGDPSASDDDLEDELDNNMDVIMGLTQNLKRLAQLQGDEVRSQMPLVERLEEKVVTEERRIATTTRRMDRIK